MILFVYIYFYYVQGFYGNGERQLIETDLDQENDRKGIRKNNVFIKKDLYINY